MSWQTFKALIFRVPIHIFPSFGALAFSAEIMTSELEGSRQSPEDFDKAGFDGNGTLASRSCGL